MCFFFEQAEYAYRLLNLSLLIQRRFKFQIPGIRFYRDHNSLVKVRVTWMPWPWFWCYTTFMFLGFAIASTSMNVHGLYIHKQAQLGCIFGTLCKSLKPFFPLLPCLPPVSTFCNFAKSFWTVREFEHWKVVTTCNCSLIRKCLQIIERAGKYGSIAKTHPEHNYVIVMKIPS